MLAEYLKTYFKDIDLKDIFTDILGTNDAAKIKTLLNNATQLYFNMTIEKILFIESSIGVVFGLLLLNQQKIILKVYSKKISPSYLEKMNSIQTIFYQENFPAPEILSPIFKFNHTYAGFYAFIEGKKEDGHEKDIRTELAKGLALFSEISDKYKLEPLENFFQQASKGKLWPVAHNVLFNLHKTEKGAAWIAKKALQARKIINSCKLKMKLAHTDWGVKNSVFHNKKLTGIFDWDSLGAMTELEMVGRAAAQFTADWESGFKITPSPTEGREFVKSYEHFRKVKFTMEEYKIISASADYLIAIISRFEHAGGISSVHPYQDLLKSCGEKSFLFAK